MKSLVFCLAGILSAVFLMSCGGETAPRNNSAPYGEPSRVLILQASFSLDNNVPAPSYSAVNAADEADAGSTACLMCHGPTFADLAALTADYIDPWGENVNPHVYIDTAKANPHDSTVIASCTRCHEPHDLPFPAGAVKTATLRYCYNCHHTEDLVACVTCHNE
jgi:predicted CXXCH cytochrome family protein